MQSRQANQLVQQYDLGDLSKELEKIQQGKSLAQDIDHTKAEKKTQLIYDQRFGREECIKHIEKNHPDFSQKYAKAQELLQALEQLRQHQRQQERAQQKEKSKGKDFGMEL
jgi:hypothetical protein